MAADRLTLTTFVVDRSTPHPSLDTGALADICDAAGYTRYGVIIDPVAAYHAALEGPEPVILFAGSFFLLNHIRPLLK
jgi:hypothetical protein